MVIVIVIIMSLSGLLDHEKRLPFLFVEELLNYNNTINAASEVYIGVDLSGGLLVPRVYVLVQSKRKTGIIKS